MQINWIYFPKLPRNSINFVAKSPKPIEPKKRRRSRDKKVETHYKRRFPTDHTQ